MNSAFFWLDFVGLFMPTLTKIRSMIADHISISTEHAASFFKTGPGDYAAHDRFIGVTVPDLRKIAQQLKDLSLHKLQNLMASCVNEERLLALIILVAKYKQSSSDQKEKYYRFYLNNLLHINNWNLVDASAHLIIGAYLFDKDRHFLEELAQSDNLWERRIAIVSTWYFIRQNDTAWTFKIALMLLNDKKDLIHKAVGWMLREAGKRNEKALMAFLADNASNMPRTMLRYAIEKFPLSTRKAYLANY